MAEIALAFGGVQLDVLHIFPSMQRVLTASRARIT
jgi:hypothetical protein